MSERARPELGSQARAPHQPRLCLCGLPAEGAWSRGQGSAWPVRHRGTPLLLPPPSVIQTWASRHRKGGTDGRNPVPPALHHVPAAQWHWGDVVAQARPPSSDLNPTVQRDAAHEGHQGLGTRRGPREQGPQADCPRTWKQADSDQLLRGRLAAASLQGEGRTGLWPPPQGQAGGCGQMLTSKANCSDFS